MKSKKVIYLVSIKKKDFKYNGKYYLENRHGLLNIKKKDISDFKKKFKSENICLLYD